MAVVVDNSNVQVRQFVNYTRPFTKKAQPQSEWDKAIAEGAVTVDEFIDELNALIDKWPDDEA